jgi:amino acid adenylation domain-containing protein
MTVIDTVASPDDAPVTPIGPYLAGLARLLTASVIHEDSSPYVITAAYELRGPVDTGRLGAAVRALPALHLSLAVRYELAGGTLRMTAVPGGPGRLRVHQPDDETGLPDSLPERARDLIADWVWDLSDPPHLRADLWVLGPDRFLLVVGVHHIAADAMGFDSLLKDLSKLYNGQLALPDPAALPDIGAVGWAEPPAPGFLRRCAEYWRRQFAGPGLAPLELPLPAPDVGTARHDRLLHDEVEFPLATGGPWPGLSVTPGSAVTALFGAYLALVSGQEEACIAYPIPAPQHADHGRRGAPLGGPSLGILRLGLAADTTVAALVRACQHKVLAGMRHPHGALEAWNDNHRAGAGTLPNVIVQWVPTVGYWMPPGWLAQVDVSRVRTPLWVSEFDLDLWVCGRWDTLSCRLGFHPDRMPPDTVAALTAGFQAFFGQAMACPQAQVRHLALAGRGDGAPAREDPRAGDAKSVGSVGAVGILGGVARADPGLDAITTADGVMSYGDLHAAIARWARVLAAQGAGRGDRIAVDVRPGVAPECPYGIWAAGAVYVPLTSDLPADRVRYLIGAARAGVVVTDRPDWYAQHLPGLAALDARAAAGTPSAGGRAPVMPSLRPGADWPAYVVFTSGSMGLPKAVEATHGNLLAAVCAFQQVVAVPAGARIAQTSAAAFDPALLEMLLPVLVGGCQVIAPDPVRRDPRQLARWIDAERVDFIEATPTVWEELARCLQPLRHRPAVCASGGEVLTVQLADKILALGVELWNLYGPSETTIWATAHRCGGAEQPAIGRPLPGVSVRVVSRDLQTLPAGLVGEIVIGGPGVTRGYPGDAELTAQRFVTVPGGDGLAAYRSGDRGWWGDDGELRYAGRADRQVKIGGKRIDPAEVEVALAGYPGVRQAVATVVPVAGRPGMSVCGYVVADQPPDRDGILQFLREKLPRHAVPAALVDLADLPRTSTGKVDGAGLPPPADSDLLAPPARYVAPVTATEATVASAFGHILGTGQAGRLDDFFDLGGTSLSGLRLVRLLEGLLGKEVPVSAIYTGITVQGIAELLDG